MRKVHVGVEQREMVTPCCQHLHPCCCGDKEQHEDTQTCEKKNTAVMQLIALVALRSLSPPRPVLGRERLLRSRHLGDATLAQMMLVSEMLRCCT